MLRYSLVGAFAALAAVSYAANPVLVDKAGTGNFTTIQGAIDSFCVGGANAGSAAPFVIKIKAGSGPYEEALTLDVNMVGKGNIAGDLVIESDTPGTKVVVKLMAGGSTTSGATDDALFINQNEHDVTFRDLVFSRSTTAFAADELVRVDETAANTTMNTMSFYNCVFTEATAANEPMVTDKAGALLPPPTRGGGTFSANPRLLQIFGDTGESMSAVVDNCVFYNSPTANLIVRLEGVGNPETLLVNNCLSTYAGGDCFNLGGINPNAVVTVTGTDQTAGPLNCTAALHASMGGANFGHCFTVSNTGAAAVQNGQVLNVSKIIAYAATPTSNATARGFSASHGKVNLSNALINVPSYGTVAVVRTATVWDRLSINTPTSAFFGAATTGSTPAEGSLTIRNSVISGAGTKFGNILPAGGVIVENSALPTSGPNAITAVGGGASVTQTNVINDDPQYASMDGFQPSFLDVANPAYAGKGTNSSNLSGGATFAGNSGVSEWSVY